MKSYRYAALAAITACAALALSAPAHAQTSIYSEQDKLIRADRTVGVLGADLFGDKVNFYNGTLEFTQTDVSIPGNNALPASIGRRLVTGSNLRVYGVYGAFADWDLDIPHMHGVFAKGAQSTYGNGWSAQFGGGRCTNYSAPPNVIYQGASWSGDEYWHGSFMYLPGVGFAGDPQPCRHDERQRAVRRRPQSQPLAARDQVDGRHSLHPQRVRRR